MTSTSSNSLLSGFSSDLGAVKINLIVMTFIFKNRWKCRQNSECRTFRWSIRNHTDLGRVECDSRHRLAHFDQWIEDEKIYAKVVPETIHETKKTLGGEMSWYFGIDWRWSPSSRMSGIEKCRNRETNYNKALPGVWRKLFDTEKWMKIRNVEIRKTGRATPLQTSKTSPDTTNNNISIEIINFFEEQKKIMRLNELYRNQTMK